MTVAAAPIELKSDNRNTTLNPRQLRAEGWVPATLYGPGLPAKSIQIDNHEFLRKYHSDKHRQFVLTGVDGAPTVRVKQIQVHSVSQAILNIEFMPV
jgi:ribosomal protein L25 (general stress protein Ctc)